MTDLVVIVPSRGRPESVGPLIQAFRSTCTAETLLLFSIDHDDPAHVDYLAAAVSPASCIENMRPTNMVGALNRAAQWLVGPVPSLSLGDSSAIREPFAIGFMGDDHCPRTVGWDQAYLDALRELGTGIVYGNDLLQGEALPTQCAMTSDIVRALGHMAPPGLTHLFVDDYWRDLGRSADCLRYLPDVVVEHMHPVAGKAEWSEGHRRVNAPAMYQADSDVYMDYRRTRFYADVAAVKALRGAR